MPFSERLKGSIEEFHLLSHPFYQNWSKGALTLDVLKNYAREYYVHVRHFPRYISATHSQCDDLEQRRILLENLNDEEGFRGTPHPDLWAEFAYGVGVCQNDIKDYKGKPPIQNVITTFMRFAKSSYPEGLAALYAYEYQVPEIAETKIEGLKSHYGVSDSKPLEFFEVHKEADKHHRLACEQLIDQFEEQNQEAAIFAARTSARALWDFLTSFEERADAA